MTIGQQVRKRRQKLKMSVDDLAKRIGKDRSTIYRYENGDIGKMPLELFLPMIEALEITPQELLATMIASSEWYTARAGKWLEATEGYEFSSEELKLFCEIAKYLMQIRDDEDYDEKINCLFTLFKQFNQ